MDININNMYKNYKYFHRLFSTYVTKLNLQKLFFLYCIYYEI